MKLIEWVRTVQANSTTEEDKKLQMDEDLATWRMRRGHGIFRAPTL
jgi:hypothetical protein